MLWSGTDSGNYAQTLFNGVISDVFYHSGADAVDWSLPVDLECQFQLTAPVANGVFRCLLGRTATDQNHADSFNLARDVNGIGFAVENLELNLVTCVNNATVYHLDTGYALPSGFTAKVHLKSAGNGIVKVYVTDSNHAAETLVYTLPRGQWSDRDWWG